MSLTLTLLKYANANNPDRIFLQVGFVGNYPAGGDTLNLNPGTFLDPTGVGVIGYPENPPKVLPAVRADLNVSGATKTARVIQGTTLANYKLQILNADGTDLAAGAYAFDTGSLCEVEVEF